jgi:hypothetical protein
MDLYEDDRLFYDSNKDMPVVELHIPHRYLETIEEEDVPETPPQSLVAGPNAAGHSHRHSAVDGMRSSEEGDEEPKHEVPELEAGGCDTSGRVTPTPALEPTTPGLAIPSAAKVMSQQHPEPEQLDIIDAGMPTLNAFTPGFRPRPAAKSQGSVE